MSNNENKDEKKKMRKEKKNQAGISYTMNVCCCPPSTADYLFHCKQGNGVLNFQGPLCANFTVACYTAGRMDVVGETSVNLDGGPDTSMITVDSPRTTSDAIVVFFVCVLQGASNGQFLFVYNIQRAGVQGTISFDLVVNVQFFDPRFTADEYRISIPPFKKIGHRILPVNASRIQTCDANSRCIQVVTGDVEGLQIFESFTTAESVQKIQFQAEEVDGVSFGSFTVSRELSPLDTVVTTLLAVNKMGSATTVVKFTVFEMEGIQPPRCVSTSLTVVVESRSAVNSLIVALNCFDSYTPNEQIDYVVVPGDFSDFLSIDQEGEVSVKQSLLLLQVSIFDVFIDAIGVLSSTRVQITIIVRGIEPSIPKVLKIQVGDVYVGIEHDIDLNAVMERMEIGQSDWPFFECNRPKIDRVTFGIEDFPTLLVTGLTPGQLYTDCTIALELSKANTVSSDSFRFQLRDTPRVVISPGQSLLLLPGESLKLNCDLEPRDWTDVTFKWNYSQETGQNESALFVESPQSGVYECEVTYSDYSDPIRNQTTVFASEAIYGVEVDIDTELEWVEALDDMGSFTRDVLSASLESRVNQILKPRLRYIGSQVRKLTRGLGTGSRTSRSTGTVVATMYLSEGVSKASETTDVVDVLKESVSLGMLRNATYGELDEDGLFGTSGIFSDIIDPMTENINGGSNASINATYWAIVRGDVLPRSVWSLNGGRLYPHTSEQFTTHFSVMATTKFPQGYILDDRVRALNITATLRIRDLQRKHVGIYNSTVSIAGFTQSQILNVSNFRFQPAPTVVLTPRTLVTASRTYVNVTCNFTGVSQVEILRVGTTELLAGPTQTSETQKQQSRDFSIYAGESMNVVCRGHHSSGSRVISSRQTKITAQDDLDAALCPAVEEEGFKWPSVPVGVLYVADCVRPYTGFATRNCTEGGVWGSIGLQECVKKEIKELLETAEDILSGVSQESLSEVGANLTRSLNYSEAGRTDITSGDLEVSLSILTDVADFAQDAKREPTTPVVVKEFGLAADLLLSADTSQWKSLEEDDPLSDPASRLLTAMDELAEGALRSGQTLDSPLVTQNIVIKQGAASSAGINFPTEEDEFYEEWVEDGFAEIHLDQDALSQSENVTYSVIMFRPPESLRVRDEIQVKYRPDEELFLKTVSSNVASVTVQPKQTVDLKKPLELIYKNLPENYSKPVCAFLDTSARVSGLWSTDGCVTKTRDDGAVVCSCSHLTNFAVLMSPHGGSSDDILSIITIVGCSISIFCLVVTIIVYYYLWRYVKSDRSVLHVHLSVCLILAYVTFLVGLDRTESEVGCTVVAALLHFLFLTVFFLMMSEGIEVAVSVTMVFEQKSLLCKLLPFSYGVPLVIVGATLGITQADDYHSDDFCWLSIDSGVFWSFAGPALAVLVVNYLIIIIVVKTILNTTCMMTKSGKEKTRGVLKAIAVLSPLLGITWLLGIFAVNEDTVVFQYLFAIVNSLQGLFIFIFYVLLCHQVVDGYRAKKRKYRARSLDSGQKVTNKSYSDSESGPKARKNIHSSSDSGYMSTDPTDRTVIANSNRSGYGDSNLSGSRQGYGRTQGVPAPDYGNDNRMYDVIEDNTKENPPSLRPPAEEGQQERRSFKERWRAFQRRFSSKRTKQEREQAYLKEVYGNDINAIRSDQGGLASFPMSNTSTMQQKNGSPQKGSNLARNRWDQVRQWAHTPGHPREYSNNMPQNHYW